MFLVFGLLVLVGLCLLVDPFVSGLSSVVVVVVVLSSCSCWSFVFLHLFLFYFFWFPLFLFFFFFGLIAIFSLVFLFCSVFDLHLLVGLFVTSPVVLVGKSVLLLL